MLPLRLVIDSNILVSVALNPDGLQRTASLLAIISACHPRRPGCSNPDNQPQLWTSPARALAANSWFFSPPVILITATGMLQTS